MNSKNDATLGRICLAPKKILEIYRFVNVNVKFGYELRDLEYPFGVPECFTMTGYVIQFLTDGLFKNTTLP